MVAKNREMFKRNYDQNYDQGLRSALSAARPVERAEALTASYALFSKIEEQASCMHEAAEHMGGKTHVQQR